MPAIGACFTLAVGIFLTSLVLVSFTRPLARWLTNADSQLVMPAHSASKTRVNALSSRASTSSFLAAKTWMAGTEPGHDVESAVITSNCLRLSHPRQNKKRARMSARSSSWADRCGSANLGQSQRPGCAEALIGPWSPCAETAIGLPALKLPLSEATIQRRLEPPST